MKKVGIGKKLIVYIMKLGGMKMIVLTKRQTDILKFLCNQEDFITLDFIAKKFSISKRTVQNDINQVDAFLKEKKFELVKKAGSGILINSEHLQKSSLYKEIDNLQMRSFSKSERNILIKTVLLSKPLCTFQELADICLVSKQTIINSFDSVINELLDDNLRVEKIQGFGLRLQGEEIDIRRTFIQLINDNPCPQIVQSTAYEYGNLSYYENKVTNILKGLETKYFITFSNTNRLKMILLYVLSRIDKEYLLSKDMEFINLSQQQEASQITDFISKYVNIANEQLYISTIILSERINEISKLPHSQINHTQDEAYQIAVFLVESLQNLQPIKQEYLQDTIHGLTLHLRSAINRYRNNLQIKNELVEQIKIKCIFNL